jgi:hypothetical protein
MNQSDQSAPVGKAALWIGWIITVLPALLLLMGGVMNVLKVEEAVKGATDYGYPEPALVPLGIVVIISVVLYLIPQTAVLGAILLTGYLGGAVATHVRAGDPMFQMIFPAIFGAILWFALWLRDRRVRSLVPLRQ